MIFNAIEYSEINCIYIYISPGRKESFFGKKKITEIEKLWITSFIDFQSSLRKGELLVVEKRNYNLILLEKKKKKERRSEDCSKEGSFCYPTNHFPSSL